MTSNARASAIVISVGLVTAGLFACRAALDLGSDGPDAGAPAPTATATVPTDAGGDAMPVDAAPAPPDPPVCPTPVVADCSVLTPPNAPDCPADIPTSKDCTGIPEKTYCQWAVSGNAQQCTCLATTCATSEWACTGTTVLPFIDGGTVCEGSVGPPGIDPMKRVEDLTDTELAAWCLWAQQGQSLPDNPGMSGRYVTGYGFRSAGAAFALGCAAQLPVDVCMRNMRLQTCDAPIQDLSDCAATILWTEGVGWGTVYGRGCGPYQSYASCDETFVQRTPVNWQCWVPVE